MASITYTKQVSVPTLYSSGPSVDFVPYYTDDPIPSFADTVIYYNSVDQAVDIGAVASFNDGNNQAVIGYDSPTTGYVKASTSGNRVYIGAQTIEINNLTLATTSGGASGKHLPLVIGGTLYKIALLLP